MTRTNLFSTYAKLIAELSPAVASSSPTSDHRLLLDRDENLEVWYAPFDYVNQSARVVLVGITPGRQQMALALAEASRALRAGATELEASKRAKGTASFGGPMRSNLIAMLDHIDLHGALGIQSCADLFGKRADLIHYTSALRYPVFVDGGNYSGTPNMTRHPLLTSYLRKYFKAEVVALPHAVFIPLGPKVEAAMQVLVGDGAITPNKVLFGLPHPSGANAERIAYFLGRKPRDQLSSKTDPVRLDDAKAALMRSVIGAF